MWIIIIISSIFLIQILGTGKKEEITIEFKQYEDLLTSGQITEATIIERQFHGTLKEQTTLIIQGRPTDVKKFNFILPPNYDQYMLADWEQYNLRYNFQEQTVEWTAYLFQILPWFLFIGIWIFFMRRMQGQNNKGIFGFGKSKARLWTSDRPKTSFADVAGCVEAKEELQEIIEFLKQPEKFSKLGGKIPKGALLLGPPGTGKTLLAKAVAGEAAVPFFSISGADFVEMFVGVGASRVRDLFEQGKKNSPCIIFIDEIDAVGRHRGAGLGGGHDEREQTLNQLLVEMDGFDENTNVIIIAATNRPDVLDSALLRPGRFDRQIVVDVPDVKGREGILLVHTKKIPLAKEINLSIIAKGTPGLVGADLANLVNEAALLAARKNKKAVENEDFEEAKDKVMMGVERKSLQISEKERISTSYHESGHVLVAMNIPDADPIHKVTIVPRGRALGITHQLPMDERHNYSRTFINGTLCVLLGGRAAEKIIFNELTTGAGNDIERATELARKMVCEWGMSERLGPLTYGKKEQEIFLGREITQHRDFSEDTAKIIDEEVRIIVETAEIRANKILKDNLKSLKLLAETLLEHEVIDGEDIKRLLEGKKLKNPKNNNKSATKSKPVKPTTKLTKTASPKKPVKKESTTAAKTDDK
ncbi:ATP-dependent zinc metalloprotease FtsH [bacterium]|nr:ATP-dependent zinc metalloprotease FtsH [bacterium]MBU1064205.1 ATP-dependent zinc metalloprotease FtsH [bacterium]MBU1633197.1 ATP-dependent zinc metalloprotease FtsH [bacterium]MBU1874714.1 ATP-dependent zinc metalloprotease FtsH [bacterium]